ncbi:hypothetical protein CON22_17970 [Bacillus cereus]|nr:hypothetical protein CON22_17970 [Bacillus cereus]
MRTKDFSKNTHRMTVLEEMDVSTLVRNAHSVTTFTNQHYIVLDNGNLYDQDNKREIPVYKVFRYIRSVKNSYGVLIAKRSNTRTSLKQVKYARK